MAATAFLLAAGLGTRLRPLTAHRPKPLVPLLGAPLLDHAVAVLAAHGHEEVVVNAHHLAPAIHAWAERAALKVRVSEEREELLGTGGGLRQARAWLAERFVVVNGDVLTDVDLGALLAGLGDRDAVMALRPQQPGEAYGIVALDAAGTVVDLVGLAEAAATPPVRRDCHFTGLHALRTTLLDHVPATGAACIVRSAYRAVVPTGRVAGQVHHGTWVDLGDPAGVLRANLEAVSGRLRVPFEARPGVHLSPGGGRSGSGVVDVHPTAELLGPCWVGEGAVIEAEARLGPGVVVGSGARVGRGAVLQRSVVWDGVVVPAGEALDQAIAHDGGTWRLPHPA